MAAFLARGVRDGIISTPRVLSTTASFRLSQSPQSEPSAASPRNGGLETRLAEFLYRRRWILALLTLAVIAALGSGGWRRLIHFSNRVYALGDISNGLDPESQPLVFDSRFDIWFDADDEGLRLYKDIEHRFVAEDSILIGLEELEEPFGVFSRKTLATIARVSDELLKVPGVRDVRSLTSSPWIRYGLIGGDGGEQGLIVTDLVEPAPAEILDPTGPLSDRDLLERMIAVLGAENSAGLVGESKVRDFLGDNARFEDYHGEPRMQDSLVSADGRTTVIQIQVLRPKLSEALIANSFPEHERDRRIAPSLFATETQTAALRGVEHVLRTELGLAIPTPESQLLQQWIGSLEEGEEKDALDREFKDPRRNFMLGPDGELVRKFFEYDLQKNGKYVDLTDPSNPVTAPEDFRPKPRSEYEFHSNGMPVVERHFTEVGQADLKMVAWMFLVISAVLMLLFRHLGGMAISLMVVFASLTGMMGVLWLQGYLLNNLTAITPNMITAVGIADAVHLCAAFFAYRKRSSNKKEVLLAVLRANMFPVFLTTVTTAVGFLSLMTNDLFPVRNLGSTAVIGVFFAWWVTMATVPAFLSLMPVKGSTDQSISVREAHDPVHWLQQWHWGDWLTKRVLKRRRALIVFSVFLLLFSCIGLSRLRLDTDLRMAFPETDPVIVSFNWLEDRLGGIGDLEMVFEAPGDSQGSDQVLQRQAAIEALEIRRLGHEEDPGLAPLSSEDVKELERLKQEEGQYQRGRIAVSANFLRRLTAFEKRLREEIRQPDSPLFMVTDMTSPLDVLRKVHQVQNENQAEFYRVPSSEDIPPEALEPHLGFDEFTEEWSYTPPQSASTLAAQYYLQYENGAKPSQNLSSEISSDRRSFRMQVRMAHATSYGYQKAFDYIRKVALEEFPELVGDEVAVAEGRSDSTLAMSGKILLYSGMSWSFTVGFAKSLALALTVITLLIGFLFRSTAIALISMVPNVLPILLPLSVFGWLGLALDGPSVIVASIALGVCVDDTIHFFTKFIRAHRGGFAAEDALRLSFRQVGAALTITTVVLCLGFFVLSFSQFRPNIMLGRLAVAMIALAWICDFVLTPAFLSLLPDHPSDRASSPEPRTS
ncbi:MAG: hypothetical protein DWQ01_07435 [Planctomycetota bacterium]|nr:MAG: hypothetical protein DWQ01_07435 [Planctomycetota bacterium]